jgi:hypothetical protein
VAIRFNRGKQTVAEVLRVGFAHKKLSASQPLCGGFCRSFRVHPSRSRREHLRGFHPRCFTSAWAVLIGLLLCSSAKADSEFVPLLSGKNLDDWVHVGEGPNGYSVQDGVLVCPAEETGNLFSRKEYANFVLRFEFRLQEASNNGVAIRSPLRKDAHLTGTEIQILDDQAPRYQGIVKPVQYHGSIYGVVGAKRGFLKKVGDWNEQEIRADGHRVRVTLNGAVIVDADLGTITDPDILREHSGLLRRNGHIGFLAHRSRVEFRNLRIKELP